ncbi:cobalt import ATP-binding protein CbiO [bacterium BMS3Bbin06]|nr:cobalt import ATP-binding protein CbiO [bacterium BMS3Abin08]GBE35224.1 cobalt import ATP-binding protein CbiO [bacterium BMS3Bbin06]HDO35676.1 ABC transporter ATP-binding protein [Nitrospirota bacterium]HDY71802.1 ABC transporter ATP-binding protein [Nitrospirota bacterium]
MSHHIVDFRDVSYKYPDGTKALNKISFRVTHGEAVGIVGPNGAGKTTLIMHMNGQLLPGPGEIMVGDLPLTRKTRTEIRKKVGIVLQNPDDQLFMPTVYEDVGFGPTNLGLLPDAVGVRVRDALREVGCADIVDRPPHRLSGGQKKAVAIAGVIAMKPDILVMDEPSANLDPKARRNLIDILKGFHHSRIIASHDLDLILEVCERCIVLYNGEVKADGKAEDILLDEALMKRCDLELPVSVLFQRRQQ